MKILLVHNYYGKEAPSGENVVFDNETRLLRAAGLDVSTETVSSDGLERASIFTKLRVGLCAPWAPRALWNVRRRLDSERFDVLHVHNTFPLLSPAIVYAAVGRPTATVLTLHNYRVFCAAGNHMRSGSICERCYETGSAWSSVLYGCYRGSRMQTIPVAAMIGLHSALKTWEKVVDIHIAQTEYQKQRLISGGFPREKVFVKQHFCDQIVRPVRWIERDERAVFVGRISRNKGLAVLLHAWQLLSDRAPALDVVGDGPDLEEMKILAASLGLGQKVRFHGFVSDTRKMEIVAHSKVLLMPTLWFETFGLVLIEALSVGVPVIASDLSCLSQVVTDHVDGRLVKPGEPAEWAKTVDELWRTPHLHEEMSAAAEQSYKTKYSPDVNIKLFKFLYEKAVIEKRKKLYHESLRTKRV